jgi:hypothetical protein
MHAIAKALRYNTGLRALSMDGNFFESCGKQLLESLQHNTSLQSVLDRLPAILARKGGDFCTWNKVEFLLRTNKANRRFLQDESVQQQHMPFILQGAGVQPDVFFHFLSNSANRFPTAAMARKPNNSPPRTFVPSDKLPERSAVAATPLRRQCACFPPSA